MDHKRGSNISRRETEVLLLIAQEYSTKELADLLNISTHTANSHRKNLMSKMGARNTAGLVRRGFELNILNTNSNLI